MSHVSVMLNEVIANLKPVAGETYVDGTFGYGGYTQAFLDSADCTVVAIDRDPSAQKRAETLKAKYGDRLVFIHGCFGDVEGLLKSAGFEKIDGFVLDLGVSSMQLDQAERGFSFRFDGPLDMRMDTSRGATAADIVNQMPEKELADLIYKFGEERHSRRVAKTIVERRREEKFTRTGDLAAVVRSVVPRSGDDIDPATRTFQALRIAVNDELGELERAMDAAEKILNPGGRVIVVSFHSLEDSFVKSTLRAKSGNEPGVSRHALVSKPQTAPLFSLISKKAAQPTEEEARTNPRARSARLRAAIRTEAKC
jgi:16S rRNA (cytosine1402-N4)-methyltransferase